ncbi:hypothetical protein DPMN_155880 [Dreissena polymorpha]|uniref:Uncharacterized protein n=1 Tax=Dreissena polymorpha TaxID=45954 RepID=A0A9D4JBS6_DREPO|nr:hypothetical protein DPMN_155880 [Dreissena polymorpha]
MEYEIRKITEIEICLLFKWAGVGEKPEYPKEIPLVQYDDYQPNSNLYQNAIERYINKSGCEATTRNGPLIRKMQGTHRVLLQLSRFGSVLFRCLECQSY